MRRLWRGAPRVPDSLDAYPASESVVVVDPLAIVYTSVEAIGLNGGTAQPAGDNIETGVTVPDEGLERVAFMAGLVVSHEVGDDISQAQEGDEQL